MSEGKKRVGVVFELEEGADQKETIALLDRLRFGVNLTWPIFGDPVVFESITPLVEVADYGDSAVEAGLFGLSRELEIEDARHFASQVRLLSPVTRGLRDVRTSILSIEPTGRNKDAAGGVAKG